MISSFNTHIEFCRFSEILWVRKTVPTYLFQLAFTFSTILIFLSANREKFTKHTRELLPKHFFFFFILVYAVFCLSVSLHYFKLVSLKIFYILGSFTLCIMKNAAAFDCEPK